MSAPENPPAFPVAEVRAVDDGSIGISEGHPGMTLRDGFAGQALAGLCASTGVGERADMLDGVRGGRRLSLASFAIADAMLAERERQS